jgi:hypothetical protein
MKAQGFWVRTLFMTGAAAGWLAACGASTDGGDRPRSAGGNGGSGALVGSGGLNLDGSTSGGSSSGGTSGGGTCRAEACVTSSHEGEEIPLDMYIMMDRSGSMNDPTGGGSLWDAVKNAFIEFVQSPQSAGVGVGIQFFPLGTFACTIGQPPPCPPGCSELPFLGCFPTGGGSCEPNDYLPPAVVIQPLPGVAPQIVAALNGTSPGGGTPTVPAMDSAVRAATAYAQQVPGHKVIIVLATDGEPNDCNSTVDGVGALAEQAFTGSPSVPTFVIGIGNLAGLDQIAQRGGTGTALVVNPATAGQDFLSAMNDIRGRALSCAFEMPAAPTGSELNLRQVNVQFTPPSGSCEVIYHVGAESQCDPALGGWFYDDPANPSEIRTCPATCNRLTLERGRVDLQLGCGTIDIPE